MDEQLKTKLTFSWQTFRAVTEELPGTSGHLRQMPEDFQVEEVPLYEPQGSGSHAYALVEKTGLTTRDLVLALMREGLEEKSIGVAGLKDKHAVTKQWLSVPQRFSEALDSLDSLEGVTILERSRHKNKLAVGHLKGNYFKVRVREPDEGALDKAEAILKTLETKGLPNYFGPQRFGRGGTNAVDGYNFIHGEWVPGGQRLKRFFVSALQSLLFNHLLNLRIERGIFDALILGDWAKKHDTGGVFKVEDVNESERAKRFEVSATLPLYGKKVKLSEAEAGEMEQEVLDYFGLRWVDFTSRKGDRRFSRLKLENVSVHPEDDGYTLSFFLPKGAFATSVLREVLKTDVDVAETSEDVKA